TTSGSVSRARRTAAAPSGASPTTVNRPSISSILRRRTRYSSRSSASRTVIINKVLSGWGWGHYPVLGVTAGWARCSIFPHLGGPDRSESRHRRDATLQFRGGALAAAADLGGRPELGVAVPPPDLLALLPRA